MKPVALIVLAGVLSTLSGCAVYGPPPQSYYAGPYYPSSPVYTHPAPGYAYGYGPPTYYHPAPVYVAPPAVSFRFGFGYWRGHGHRHGFRGGWGGLRRRW